MPLVDNIVSYETAAINTRYQLGWCTYYYEFADSPEVEFFCGGLNTKTPRASALWRQGNLLHFGFEQSPRELNSTGKALLINSIVYISQFTEDLPIDYSPSVFSEKPIPHTRRRAKAVFFSEKYRLEWADGFYSAATLKSFDSSNRKEAQEWYEKMGDWLHPGPEVLLEVDELARELGFHFNRLDFIPQAITAMASGEHDNLAVSVLARYAPDGPGVEASHDEWLQWWKENGPYLFYSEMGGYRWYIDPLAKKRSIPTKDLRGPSRKDTGQ